MILSAQSIRKLCVELRAQEGWINTQPIENAMIEPFVERGACNGRTYGLSSCGYDVRLDQDIWLWPFWGRLGSVIEYIHLPNDICAEVKDKSSNARLFVFVQNTIIEPGWEGFLTLELTRFLPWPIRLRKGTPIAQIVFKRLDEPTDQPYKGKYNKQSRGPQPAILSNQK